MKKIEAVMITGDLIPLFKAEGIAPQKMESRAFLKAVAEKLNA